MNPRLITTLFELLRPERGLTVAVQAPVQGPYCIMAKDVHQAGGVRRDVHQAGAVAKSAHQAGAKARDVCQ